MPRTEEARVGVGKKEVPYKAKYVGHRAKVTTEEGWRLRLLGTEKVGFRGGHEIFRKGILVTGI